MNAVFVSQYSLNVRYVNNTPIVCDMEASKALKHLPTERFPISVSDPPVIPASGRHSRLAGARAWPPAPRRRWGEMGARPTA